MFSSLRFSPGTFEDAKIGPILRAVDCLFDVNQLLEADVVGWNRPEARVDTVAPCNFEAPGSGDLRNQVNSHRRNAQMDDPTRVGYVFFRITEFRATKELAQCRKHPARVCRGGLNQDVQILGRAWPSVERDCVCSTRR